MKLLIIMLIVYGVSNIMIFSSIFKKWREFWDKHSPNFFGELFNCMICLPFWVGAVASIFIFSISKHYLIVDNLLLGTFLDASLSSGGVWLIHNLQEKLER